MKISFCVTSRNRLWQIKKTLERNLSLIGNHEISLVNYGCEQNLDSFVDNFRSFIDVGSLRYFSAKGISQFHMAKSKNLSHRIATGDILFNLDGDNYLSIDMIQKTVDLFQRYPCAIMHAAYADGSTKFGTCGRIALHRQNFYHLGGYDESLLPMGAQDTNLIERGIYCGLPYFLIPCDSDMPVANSINDKAIVSKASHANNYDDMNHQSKYFGRSKMTHEGYCRRFNFSTYAGVLNFSEELIIHGGSPECAPILPGQTLCPGESIPRWIQREIAQNRRHRTGIRGWINRYKSSLPKYYWDLKYDGRATWKKDEVFDRV